MGDYIAQFVKEVVQKDVKGLLPHNMSDKWLEILSFNISKVTKKELKWQKKS